MSDKVEQAVDRIAKALNLADLSETRWHRRLRDFQALDRVVIEVVPRYKTSGLSGDEWRQSVKVTGLFKGIEIFGFICGRDMETAFAMLPGKRIEWGDHGLADELIAQEKECCDQPSCLNGWTVQYEVNKLTADDGSWLDPADKYFTYYRQFCDEHKRRGDCSREDADENYKLVATR